METENPKSPPPCGEVEIFARSEKISGGGRCARVVPHPENASHFPTSPQGGGHDIIAIARSWIGTPYVHQASVKGAGCDCLGLLRGVWRELHGAEPETPPAYSPDWAEATPHETLYKALARHLTEIAPAEIQPGDVALFRMQARGPAKHCAIIGNPALMQRSGSAKEFTMIHARQNHRVAEEPFSPVWRRKLAHAFRL